MRLTQTELMACSNEASNTAAFPNAAPGEKFSAEWNMSTSPASPSRYDAMREGVRLFSPRNAAARGAVSRGVKPKTTEIQPEGMCCDAQ